MMGWIGIALGALKGWAMLAGVAALAVIVFLIRQAGVDAERAKQMKADLKAAAEIQKSRTKARSASDAELDTEIDRWTRK